MLASKLPLRFPLTALFCVAALPAAVAATTDNQEWRCLAAANGWQCQPQTVARTVYPRPPQRLLEAQRAAAKNSDETRIAPNNNLDWVAIDQLPSARRAELPSHCCGEYVEPPRDYADAERDPSSAPLRVNADQTQASAEGQVTLSGDVQISQGYRQVRSDRAELNQTTRSVTLAGNVQLREPGLLLLGERADLNLASREVSIEQATYVIHDAGIRGSAAELTRSAAGELTIERASYTSCPPENNDWQLRTEQISIDQQGDFATVRDATLTVKELPIFYFPWLRFPISDNRSSGLLFPQISRNSRNGLDIAQPIYWNVAANYDMTFTPRLLTERGLSTAVEARHLNRWAATTVTGAFLADDAGGGDQPTSYRPSYEGENRSMVALDHRGDLGKVFTRINYNEVSDRDYLRDFGNQSLQVESQSYLNRSASVGYRGDIWQLALAVEDYQSITYQLDEQYHIVPQLSANGRYPLGGQWLLSLDNQFSEFRHDDGDRVSGSRLRSHYQLQWDRRWAWGYLQPSWGVHQLSYRLDAGSDTLPNDNPSITVPSASIDAGLYFDRDTTTATQTLEPRLFYLHNSFREQSELPDFDSLLMTPSYQGLFRGNRFLGGDRIGDEQRLTAALTSRHLERATGRQLWQLSVAHSWSFQQPQVALLDPLGYSRYAEQSLAAELSGEIDQRWQYSADIAYDRDDHRVQRGSVALRYKEANGRLANLAYRYSQRSDASVMVEGQQLVYPQRIEQLDLSLVAPLFGNTRWVARWNRDLTNGRDIEVFAGLEYDSCCWRASLVARRHLERNDLLVQPQDGLEASNGILFQIQFKGLAGSSNRVDSTLSNGIYGYEKREEF